jgi:uncharacterized membrane protein
MRHVVLVSTVAVLALAPPPSRAHKGHRASPSPSAAPVAAGLAPAAAEAAEVSPSPADEPSAAEEPAPGAEAPPEAEPPPGPFEGVSWRDAFLGHLHNKLVHFPLAFGIAAGVILVLTPRWPSYEPAGRVLLLVAAVLAVGAFFSGQAQQEPFVGSPLERALELHRLAGLVTAVSLWLAVAATFVDRARPVRPLLGAWLLLALSVTGFLGGVLSHS